VVHVRVSCLRQVNGVNGEESPETLFSFDVCSSMRRGAANNSYKTVKAMELKFDMNVSTDSPDMKP